MINDKEKQILDIFWDCGIEKNEMLAFMSLLKKTDTYAEMLEWLNCNRKELYADKDSAFILISDKIYEIYSR